MSRRRIIDNEPPRRRKARRPSRWTDLFTTSEDLQELVNPTVPHIADNEDVLAPGNEDAGIQSPEVGINVQHARVNHDHMNEEGHLLNEERNTPSPRGNATCHNRIPNSLLNAGDIQNDQSGDNVQALICPQEDECMIGITQQDDNNDTLQRHTSDADKDLALEEHGCADLHVKETTADLNCDNEADPESMDEDAQQTEAGQSGDDDDVESNIMALSKARKVSGIMTSARNITALCATSTSIRMTVVQYEFTRKLFRSGIRGKNLPSYRHVQRVLWPTMLESILPLRSIHLLKETKGALTDGLTGTLRETGIVLPSEWAKYDISTTPFYSNEFAIENHSLDQHVFPDLLNCDMAVLRSDAVNEGNFLWGMEGIKHVPATFGSDVSVMLYKNGNNNGNVNWEDDGWTIQAEDDRGNFKLLATLGRTWILSASDEVEHAGEEDHSTNASIFSEVAAFIQCVMQDKLRSISNRNDRRRIDPRSIAAVLDAGDLCSILTPSTTRSRGQGVALFIAKFKKDKDTHGNGHLLFIKKDGYKEGRAGEESIMQYKLIEKMETRSPIQVLRRAERTCDSHSHSHGPVTGKLQSGEKYVVYRMLLYTDDFTARSLQHPSGSMGGCYMLPASMPSRFRGAANGVRVISLTSPGVSTNEVLKIIVEDIAKGTTTGLISKDISGNEVRIFLDVVGFVSDYPAMTHVTDVMGHSANSPCTHCTFRVRKDRVGSSFGYTNAIHSRNNSFARCLKSHEELRKFKSTEASLKKVGMQSRSDNEIDGKPLLMLSKQLRDIRSSIPKTSNGLPVVSGIFDPYQSCAIAPDHLLSGVGKNTLLVAFRSLSPGRCQYTNAVFMDALKSNGLVGRGSLYNTDSKKLYPITMSATFCAVTIAPAVFRVGSGNSSPSIPAKILQLVDCFADLVSSVYWSPKPGTDGSAATDILESGGKGDFITSIMTKAKHYVSTVHEVCVSHPNLGEELDKPNLHRILELAFHTIPVFGCARNVSEMTFEGAHQPLKRVLERTTHHEAHVSAVNHSLCHDWCTRIAAARDIFLSSSVSCNTRQMATRALCRLFGGASFNDMDSSDTESRGFVKSLEENIASVLKESIAVPIWEMENLPALWRSPEQAWEGVHNSKNRLTPKSEIEEKVAGVLSATEGAMPEDFTFFEKARFVSNSRLNSPQSYGHCTISPGMVVQVCGYPLQERIEHRQTLFYCVHSIVGNGTSNLWIGASPLTPEGEKFLFRSYDVDLREVEVIGLNECIQRVAKVHACHKSGGCKLSVTDKTIQHKEDICKGGVFYIFGRSNGYPPWMG